MSKLTDGWRVSPSWKASHPKNACTAQLIGIVLIFTTAVGQAVDYVEFENSPHWAGSWDAFASIDAVTIQGNYTFVGMLNLVATSREGGLHVFDITIPSQPALVGELPMISGFGDLAILHPYLYATSEAGITIIDVGNPSTPMAIDEIHGDGDPSYNGVARLGDTLYSSGRVSQRIVYSR